MTEQDLQSSTAEKTSKSVGKETEKKALKKTEGPKKNRRAKGEKTRKEILDATLRVIVQSGIRGVTHRSVAKEANVQLSLTTYYFKDIHELIADAFSHFAQRGVSNTNRTWQTVFDVLGSYSKSELRKISVRESLIGPFSEIACAYIVDQLTDPVSREGLIIEQTFTTEIVLDTRSRALAIAHRERLLNDMIELCRVFNKEDPEVDADIVLSTIMRLEYEGLLVAPEEIDKERILKIIRRQVGWLLGLKRS